MDDDCAAMIQQVKTSINPVNRYGGKEYFGRTPEYTQKIDKDTAAFS